MPSNLVLYRRDGACSFIPHALLNELGISYTDVALDFQNGDSKAGKLEAEDGSFSHENYKKVHPSGYVPALKVDGQIITELPAVLTYISKLAPEQKLLGSTPMEKAKTYEWLVWLSGTLHGVGYAELWRPRRFTDDDSATVHKAIIEKGRRTILECYHTMESKIDGLHVLGGKFTPVDLVFYLFYRWGSSRLGFEKEDFAERFPKYTALAKAVEGMESVQATLKQENLSTLF